MIEVDLRTRIITQDQSVFFARPGTEYRLYIDIINQSTILVDLPALDLDAGTPIDQQINLNRKVHRSRALKAWHRGRRKSKEPSRDLNDYPNSLDDAGTTQIRSVLFGFFERAKLGDLALVAPKSYNDLAYVGEIVSAQNVFTKIDGVPLYGTDAVYGRAVRWLAKTEKKFLDREIINIIHKPNAFVILPRSSYIDFYKLAYPSYSYSDIFRSKFNVEKDEFKSFDDLIIQSFFNFIAVNTRTLA